MKMSERFSSMDEVKAYVEKFKGFCSEEDYKLLLMLFGFGEQEGLYEEIEGIGKIDKSIARYIKDFNDVGLTTLASCSGIKKEHPNSNIVEGYISFLDKDNIREIVIPIANKLNLKHKLTECYLKPSIWVGFDMETDEEKEKVLKIFHANIMEAVNQASN